MASVIELTISCKDLPNLDALSKSDPMCVVFQQDPPGSETWKEIGRTETIWDNPDPEFSRKITLTFMFEERQMLKFEVYDVDSEHSLLERHNFIGRLQVSLGEIVASNGLIPFERNLVAEPHHRHHHNHGSIKIVAEEMTSCKEELEIKLGADNLPRRGPFFRRRGAFFYYELHKTNENNDSTLVYRSETLKAHDRSVEWPKNNFNLYSLCNGDSDRNITLTLWRRRSDGPPQLQGLCNTTVRQLVDEDAKHLPYTFNLQQTLGGSLKLLQCAKSSQTSFLDFVQKGNVQMHCFVAVDFTSSNRDPSHPDSLHFIHGNEPNHYQTALRSVLEIIQDYDSDKLFPALGFGAQLPPDWQISHEFFLNFHPSNPYCDGIEGVMEAYKGAIGKVRLHGPTNFAPVINHVSKFAAANHDGHNYFILLIITDGIICDLSQTTDAIVAASSLPLSIIIVGVGEADFTAMNFLDADDKPLVDSNGKTMESDIVQFVPFNEILKKAGNDLTVAKITLAREVLAELPRQFLSYMKKINVTAEQLSTANNDKKLNTI